MKKILFLLAILALTGCATAAPKTAAVYQNYEATATPLIIADKNHMRLASPDFINGDFLPLNLSCLGEGKAPILQITDVPAGAISFALISEDPDAVGGIFTHWLVWNIDVATGTIDAKNLPSGAVVGFNSGGTNKYFSPCPPTGTHHYYYRLYALDKKLDLPAKASKKNLLEAMAGHIIDEAVLMGKFERKK